ncbi:M24 family metallopeptidase [Maledivibacter halophilus]|uniref:Xaa-Pro aminopeptidase n=1 Tax=Maledivibacter halophilus TaxID=36842 RepID=A0A1T5IBU3_9FIRM|nr:M24 family metallopeptidase [Maledivibacter halophilus]SKC36661.1 Xaa-Pro aminopeptidase [Maledivibacter halophilus]
MLAERYKIPKEKIHQIESVLNQKDIDSLLILSREGSDPNLPFVIGDDAIHVAAAFINKNCKHKMITSLSDQKKFEESGIFSEVITYEESIKEVLKEEFEKMNIKKLALNISEEDNLCDGLTQGLYMMLSDIIGKDSLKEIEASSEDILQLIRSQKTDTEIQYLSESIKITQDIYDEVFSKVTCGMSEMEIADLFVEGMKKRNVVNGIGGGYSYPIVCLVRAGLAHRNPGHTKSQGGDILIMDFSVRYKGYVSDIARTAYFLRKGETKPPKEVEEAFNTAYKAISAAIGFIKEGKRGYEVDAVARKVIEDGGYPTVRHAVGHQIGRECHETGTILAPIKRTRSDGLVKVGQAYAIEPTVIQDGGLPCMLVEENVIITKTGAQLLSKRQDRLYLIPCK